MPVQLSPQKHEEIFKTIQNAFSDFTLFDNLVAKQLRKLIADTSNVEIDQKTTRKVTERYFDTDQFQNDQQKLLLAQIQIILKTAYVLILSYSPESASMKYKDLGEFLENYPEFDKEDNDELQYLFHFRNFLKVALQIIPARLNKQLLVKIAARLEGSGNEYITGGGQKPAVTRRCQIYEKEGNVSKVNKPKSKDKIATTVAHQQAQIFGGINPVTQQQQPLKQTKKRPNTHAALRDVKMIRLPSEEVRRLAQGPLDPFSRRNSSIPQPPVDEFVPPGKKVKVETHTSSLNHLSSENSVASSHSRHSYSTQHSLPLGVPINPPVALSATAVPINQLQKGISINYLSSSDSLLNNALDVIGSVDELMELDLCKSDTVIDNLPQPAPIYISGEGQLLPPVTVGGFSGSLGNISLGVQPSFPPTLQRQHSDLLDRLLSDGNPMWTEIIPGTSRQASEEPRQFNQQQHQQQQDRSPLPVPQPQINLALDETTLSAPVQMIRSVSWDVYNGSYTEDLMQYLQDTPLH